MKKLLIVFIGISFFNNSIFAQEYENEEETKPVLTPHHIGLNAGATTGIGFSYRYWPSKMGFQVTTIPTFAQGDIFVSSGLSALYLMKDNDRVDLFGYFGTHLRTTVYDHIIVDPITGAYEGEVRKTDNNLSLGLGVGLKIDFWDVLNLNLQTGYGVRNIGDEPGTFLTGEIGLYYQL
ncbi:MAG: hypothetical protein ACPG21_02970 [Crocinitomicaceae bacterium]